MGGIPCTRTTKETTMKLYKVAYIYPDHKNIGHDKFETWAEARRYADALGKKGYYSIYISEVDDL
jgi:hypothetical protein